MTDTERERSRSPEPAAAPAPAPASTEEGVKLYIGNISFDTDENRLRSTFEPFGEVVDVYLPQVSSRAGGMKRLLILIFLRPITNNLPLAPNSRTARPAAPVDSPLSPSVPALPRRRLSPRWTTPSSTAAPSR